MATILERIARCADEFPEKAAVIMGEDSLSYAALMERARDMAAALPREGVVLLFLPQSISAITAYVGCMWAGCIPSFMPLPSPKQDLDRYWASHKALLDIIKPTALLTNAENVAPMEAANLGVSILEMTTLAGGSTPPATAPSEAIALLQHSSGTTALKKGVALSHRAIEAQIESYAQSLQMTAADVVVSWLPAYHDMGLIACTVAPLVLGQTIALLDPFAWSMRPASLFEAITRHRATLCWMPNFAYEHLVRTVRPDPAKYDLRSMRAFINCSEPCKAETFDRFQARFTPIGLRESALQVCYAMAETVFALTQTPAGKRAKILRVNEGELNRGGVVVQEGGKPLLSCGRLLPGTHVEIRDENGDLCAPNRVGEIVVRSDFLFSGYYKRPELTKARVRSDGYHTNDLGFLHDGELFVLGRRDDLLIVNGRNYLAHEIEAIANAHPGLRPGRNVAIGTFNPQTGSQDVILIAEPVDGADESLLRKEVRERVHQDMGLDLRDVAIVERGWLVKSTSGKIGQAENRKKYLAQSQSETTAHERSPVAEGARNTTLAKGAPILAIVTPCFGHPELLQEALISAIDQEDAPPYRIYLVNDGCRYQRTDDVARLFARRYPDKVSYIKQKNGGLGQARNRAIEAVLQAEPSIQWLFFLDADNRLTPGFVKTGFERMGEAPGFDWYFFSMPNFGGKDYLDTSGDYTLLENLVANSCDAATFISRRIVESGRRYYTDLPMGYEDWELFLRSHASGFRGRHIVNPGFLYRRRPESMVTGSNAEQDRLMSELKKRAGPAATYAGLIEEEHERLPRWAWIDPHARCMRVYSDVRFPSQAMPLDAAADLFQRARHEPRSCHFPSFVAIGDGSVQGQQAFRKIAPWLNWWIERRLREDILFAVLRIDSTEEDLFKVSSTIVDRCKIDLPDILVFCKASFLRHATRDDEGFAWFKSSFEDGDFVGKALSVKLDLPGERHDALADKEQTNDRAFRDSGRSVRAFRLLYDVVTDWNKLRRDDPIKDRFDYRTTYLLDRRWAEEGLRMDLGHAPIFSWIKRQKPSVGIILPFVDYGGVEKIGLNSALVLKDEGYDVHLIVARRNACHIPPSLADCVTTVGFLDDEGAGQWDAKAAYFGTTVSRFPERGDLSSLNGLFAPFDVIINAHVEELHGLMRQFRSRGVKTISALQVIDKTQHGLSIGHPFQLVAYEHVYDRVLVPSRNLFDWCVGHGVPEEKMLLVPNAPGLQPSDAQLAEARAERARRQDSEPLRVLYMGRFDMQKGMDVLQQIVSATAPDKARFAWRMIGSLVVGGLEGPLDRLQDHVRIEDPRRDRESLYDALIWADVVVLPSRFEGVPLTMLEAMSVGCIVIATDVGGVAEFLPTGVGFVVESDWRTPASFVDILRRLSKNPTLVRTMSEAALAYGAAFAWRRSLAPLLDFLAPLRARTSTSAVH